MSFQNIFSHPHCISGNLFGLLGEGLNKKKHPLPADWDANTGDRKSVV